MDKHTFTNWLNSEVTATRYALLTAFEEKERLLYIVGPQLEREYMDKVGSFEETVIKEEIEYELLQKKQQMIQTALNRREAINEEQIDAEIENQRQQMLKEAAGTSEPQEFASLSSEKIEKLQELYHDIVKNFHPQTHTDLTQAHKELFEKAQEAYRRRDLEALQLIHEMLFSAQADEEALELLLQMLAEAKTQDMQVEKEQVSYATDYTLVAMIYPYLKPTAEELAIKEDLHKYRQKNDDVMREMDEIRKQFPYTAADMLSDPQKIEEYREELEHRLRTAVAERERRTKEIENMLGRGVTVNE